MMDRRAFLKRSALVSAALPAFYPEHVGAQPAPRPGFYYLAPFKGEGTEADPIMPVGAEEGQEWQHLSLRISGKRADRDVLNYCWLWLPNENRDPRLELIATHPREVITRQARQRIKSRLSLPYDIKAETFDEVVLEVMRNPPPGGWPALRPSRSTGRYEVYLGGLLIAKPAVDGDALLQIMPSRSWRQAILEFFMRSAEAQTFNENWNCAASTTVFNCQLTWDTDIGNTGAKFNWGIADLGGGEGEGIARSITGTGRQTFARAVADATNDHRCEVDLISWNIGVGSGSFGLACRVDPLMAALSGSNVNVFYFTARLSGPNHEFAYLDDGAFNLINRPADVPVPGERLGIENDSGTARCFIDGNEKFSWTDTSGIPNSQRGGLSCFSSGDSAATIGANFDDWSIQAVGAPAPSAVPPFVFTSEVHN